MAQPFSRIIQKYHSKGQLYRQLQSNVFVMTEPEVLDIYPIISRCRQNFDAIQRLRFTFEMPYEKSNDLNDAIQQLLTELPKLVSHYGTYRTLLAMIENLSQAGLNVVKSTDVLTKLPTGFLSGRYTSVANEDFERHRLFWLDSYALDEFEEVLNRLFSHGSLYPLELDDSAQEDSLDAIQQILLCLGLGMSRTLESSTFAYLPSIWDQFLSECRELVSNSQILRKIVHSDLQADLKIIRDELEQLVTDSRHHGKAEIQFESLLFTKAPARKIRDAVERNIELFNV